MSYWAAGYVADVGYVTEFQREMSPAWVHTVATILGHTAPDLSRPHRYADFGCGHGLTALAVAAAMPHCEVWGFDFNPAFVAAGRTLAQRAGLTNIHFEEASFAELAHLPQAALPMFDYVSAHGVLSWISAENRRFLFDTIGQRLAPGGLAYFGYNVTTGWAAMRPIQTLMTLVASASGKRSDLAMADVFTLLAKMDAAGAALFQTHPAPRAILARLRGEDPRYLAHEFLNREWHPLMFKDVAAAMAAIKCDFIGSATPQENFQDLILPSGLRTMYEGTVSLVARETLRDLAAATPFRRDLFQRGPQPMTAREHARAVGAIPLIRSFEPVSGMVTTPAEDPRHRTVQALCQTLLEVLEEGPRPVSDLRRLANVPEPALLEAVSVLMGGQSVDPLRPGLPDGVASASAARLIRLHAALYEDGRDQPYIAYPALGSAWRTDPVEILALDALLDGHAEVEAPLVETILNRLAQAGRTPVKDGKPVTDARAFVAGIVHTLLTRKLAPMRRLGLQTGSD